MLTTGMLKVRAHELKHWLETAQSVAVVDVRDDDRIGGNIQGSVHVPSREFDSRVGELAKSMESVHKVVFHCQLSQQRGPRCARIYDAHRPRHQQVYVLSGGFQEWAALYGYDAKLTADFAGDLYD